MKRGHQNGALVDTLNAIERLEDGTIRAKASSALEESRYKSSRKNKKIFGGKPKEQVLVVQERDDLRSQEHGFSAAGLERFGFMQSLSPKSKKQIEMAQVRVSQKPRNTGIKRSSKSMEQVKSVFGAKARP